MPARLPAAVVRFGVFEVDLRAGELRKQGLKIKLQDQPFRILAMLVERPLELVTRDEIRQRLWPEDTFVDFDHGLNNAINRLRGALRDSADNPRFIETLPRKGYRFIATVHWGGSIPLAPIPSSVPMDSVKSVETETIATHRAIRSDGAGEATIDERGAVPRESSTESERRVRSSTKSPGRLVISDIRVMHDERTRTCLIDFRVSNQGCFELIINRINFVVSDTRTISHSSFSADSECFSLFGFKRFSKVYGLDISELTEIGDRASCDVSQVVRPGESDRFAINLIARNLGTDLYRAWRLLPTLCTNFEEVNGSQVEVWLPRKMGSITVAQVKNSK